MNEIYHGKSHSILRIIEDHLRENGFDGLYHASDCGCALGELAPCDSNPLECTPGYKKLTPGGEADWIICPEKPDNPPQQGEKEKNER